MGAAEAVILGVVVGLMVLSALASFLPFIPGPVLVWSVGALYAAFTRLEHVTIWALLLMSLLMIVGATSDFWMQLFGLRMEGGSCLATLGSMTGGVLATFLLPIPIIGTVIGMVAGALLFEFMRSGELDPALIAGKTTLKVYLLSVVVEFGVSAAIIGVFLLSVWSTT